MKTLVCTLLLLITSTISMLGHADPVSAPEMIENASSAININQADVEALSQLKGVGVKKAQAIIAYREQHGSFDSLADLMKVKGIGKKLVEQNQGKLVL